MPSGDTSVILRCVISCRKTEHVLTSKSSNLSKILPPVVLVKHCNPKHCNLLFVKEGIFASKNYLPVDIHIQFSGNTKLSRAFSIMAQKMELTSRVQTAA